MLARSFCPLANPTSYGVVDRSFKAYFKERYQMLCDTPGFKEAQAIANSRDVPDNLLHLFPQGHPFWLEFRSRAQVTGSKAAELMGMHDLQAGRILDIPDSMRVKKPTNQAWDDYLERQRFPGVPSTPLDPPGNFFAAGGKVKESGAVGTLLEYVPGMVFREVGAIVITPEHLAVFNLTDLRTGKRITSLPFRLVISPDMDATIPMAVAETDEEQARIEMIEVAGEIKAPTYFLPQDKSVFLGLDYRPRGFGCVPYKRPKEYYLPQMFLEMLALGRRWCLAFSYTLSMGGKSWLLEMDEHYLSAILTILIYLHETFIAHGKPVPTDHFHYLPRGDMMHQLYSDFLGETLYIADNAPPYLDITGTQCTNFAEKMGYTNTATCLNFPAYPPDVLQNFQRLQMFAYRLVRDWKQFRWITRFEQRDDRRRNVDLVSRLALCQFAAEALRPVLEGTLVTGRYPEGARDRPSVQSRVLDWAEGYLADVLEVIHQLYGSPPFGEPLSPVVFVSNCCHAAQNAETVEPPDGIVVPKEYWKRMAAAQPRNPDEPHMWEYQQIVYCLVNIRRVRAKKQ